MDYSIFASKAVMQDNRNIFAKYGGNLKNIPENLRCFYRGFNPIDVEISTNGIGIRFFSVDELLKLQKEYDYLKVEFVFATCNGDPIFFNNGHVYTCAHGIEDTSWELLADSFDNYLKSII